MNDPLSSSQESPSIDKRRTAKKNISLPLISGFQMRRTTAFSREKRIMWVVTRDSAPQNTAHGQAVIF
jgi:hypothetical protein